MRALVTMLTLALAAPGLHGAPPLVQAIEPQGIARNGSADLVFRGERLGGAAEVLLHDAGLKVESIVATDATSVTARITASADAALGEHRVRLRTAAGLSDLVTVWVVPYPVVAEIEPAAGSLEPQYVPAGTTIWGSVTREDVDTFAIDAQAGDRLSAEVVAMRLGRAVFDPVLSIEDPAGFEIAVCDDAPLLGQDAFVTVVAKASGRHLVRVREASYGGDPSFRYLLHLGGFPRPRSAWPPGALPGAPFEATFPGQDDLSPQPMPAQDAGLARVHAAEGPHQAPSPNPVAISPLPIHVGDGVPVAPVALHGRLTDASLEWSVRLTGGQPTDVRVLARRLRMPVDPVVQIIDPGGAVVASNDDAVGGDAQLRFTPASDGAYRISVRDFRNRTGEDMVVRVEVDRPTPALRLGLERIDPRRPQFLQCMQVPRGGAFAMMLRAERQDAGGAVVAAIAGLPPGVEATVVPMPAELSATPIVLRASADAPTGGALCSIEGTMGTVAGRFEHRMPMVLGPPNDALYYETVVDRLAVAVTDPASFRVRIVPPRAPLLRLGGRALVVEVERNEGMKEPIQVRMLWNPPGISSAPTVTIPPEATSVEYPLNVSAEAPLASWQVGVLAMAPEQGGERWIASELVGIDVQDAFLAGSLQLAAAQQGLPAAMSCALTAIRPFEGPATLRIAGLPPGVTAQPVTVSNGQAEVVFPLSIAADSPLGQHKGLVVDVEVSAGDQVLSHRLAATGSLRIDKPPAVPDQAPAAPAAQASAPSVPAAPAAPPKPLSRLEQLRQAQRKADGSTAPTERAP